MVDIPPNQTNYKGKIRRIGRRLKKNVLCKS